MYLIPITVPIFKQPCGLRIATDWKRALVLLRDSLEGRYGPIAVAAPWLPAEDSEHLLEPASLTDDDIHLVPTFSARERLRNYWLGPHERALAAIAELLPLVKVVHGTVEDPARAFTYTAFRNAVRADIPSILVQDQDVASVTRDLHKNDTPARRLKAELHARLHEAQCRRAVARAGVAFLKGRATVARYESFARHLLQIEDTSYLSDEVVAEAAVERRLHELLTTQRPLRFAFSGRLIGIKGLDRSLRIIHQARMLGANVTLDIIGGGPDEAALKEQSAALGLSDHVTFAGPMPYGPGLLQRLAACDAMLFNPRMEETPRMIFDGYAAGLPLVADAIDYVEERSEADQAVLVLPREDEEEAANRIAALDRQRDVLAVLTQRALSAAHHHAADRWYARRAEATHDMVERHWHGRTPPPQRQPLKMNP